MSGAKRTEYTTEVLEDIDEAHVPDVDATPFKQVTSSRQTKAVKGRRLPTNAFTFELGSGCGTNESTGHTIACSPVASVLPSASPEKNSVVDNSKSDSLVLKHLVDIQLAVDVLESTTDNRLRSIKDTLDLLLASCAKRAE